MKDTTAVMHPDPAGQKFGPIWLTPGIGHGNAATAIYAAFTTVSLLIFLSLVQPYLLTEVLNIPLGEQGSVTGRLTLLQEVVVIIAMSASGALSDQWGRRLVYVIGFVFSGIGYFLYPLADSIAQLTIFRLIFALGASIIPTMLAAIVIDYSQPVSRGKWFGIANLCGGFGILIIIFVMVPMPARLEASGIDSILAARYTFWIASAACFVGAAILLLGLKGKKFDSGAAKPNPFVQAAAALKAGFQNRKLALAYGCAFVGRGDLVIVGTFLPLWATHAGLAAGLSTGEALAKGAIVLIANQSTILLFALAAGYLTDKFNKIAVLAVSFALAALGYFGLWFVGDPFNPLIFAAIIPLGIGEVTIVVASSALVGQEAPVQSRGSILGVFGVIGAIGIGIATFTGGELFDAIGKTAPFAMMACFNLVIVMWALYIYLTHDGSNKQ
jgi:MFS family permease